MFLVLTSFFCWPHLLPSLGWLTWAGYPRKGGSAGFQILKGTTKSLRTSSNPCHPLKGSFNFTEAPNPWRHCQSLDNPLKNHSILQDLYRRTKSLRASFKSLSIPEGAIKSYTIFNGSTKSLGASSNLRQSLKESLKLARYIKEAPKPIP